MCLLPLAQKIHQFLSLSFQLDPSKMDRVELAFRKFDLNHDGFLSREEFDMVSSKIESPSERDSFLHGI